jgi:hypothetical protein
MERKPRRKSTEEKAPKESKPAYTSEEEAAKRVEARKKILGVSGKKSSLNKKPENATQEDYQRASFAIAMAMRNTHFGWSPWMAQVRHPDNPYLRVPGPEHGIRHEVEDIDKPKLEPVEVRIEKLKRRK